MPRLSEIRQHKHRPYKYIYEFHPDTERKAWLRYDTFRKGTWRNNSFKTASAKDLKGSSTPKPRTSGKKKSTPKPRTSGKTKGTKSTPKPRTSRAKPKSTRAKKTTKPKKTTAKSKTSKKPTGSFGPALDKLDRLNAIPDDALRIVARSVPEREVGQFALASRDFARAARARPITKGCRNSIETLAEFLSHKSVARKELNLQSCLADERTRIRQRQLVYVYQWMGDLTALNLSRNDLDPEEASFLAESLEKSTTLASLDLSQNQLVKQQYEDVSQLEGVSVASLEVGAKVTYDGREMTVVEVTDDDKLLLLDAGVEALAKALRVNTSLTECSLLKNELDVESAKMLAKIGTEKRIMLSGMKRDQREADFTNKFLESADAILISSDLPFMAVLTTLNLFGNDIGPTGAAAIAEALKSGSGVLTSLNLSANLLCGVDKFGRGTYDPSGIQAIASALTGNGVLNNLVLNLNTIFDVGAIALGNALKTNKTLKKLDLGDCKIAVEGGKALASVLSESSAVLTSLDLSSNFLCGVNHNGGGIYDASGITALANALNFNAVLKKLVLSDNNIHDDGAIAIGGSLQTNSTLKELYLRRCGIRAEGGKAIGVGLKAGIAVLTSLDLSYNELDAEAGKALALALAGNEVLTSLNLSKNELDAEAGKALASALAGNTVLTSLKLTENQLCGIDQLGIGTYDSSGIRALASALGSSVLTHLEIGRNNIGDEGAKALADALKSGRSMLTYLNLEENNIGVEGVQALAEALESGTAVLNKLDISRNNIGDEGVVALAQAISKAPALALKRLVVPAVVKWDERLETVCDSRGVKLT